MRAQLLMVLLVGPMLIGLPNRDSSAATPPPPDPASQPFRKVSLGLQIRQSSDEETQGHNPRGVAVTLVEAGSVGAKAGIREGDYLVKFDGQDVNVTQDIWRLIALKNPGDAVPIVVLRSGSEVALTAQF